MDTRTRVYVKIASRIEPEVTVLILEIFNPIYLIFSSIITVNSSKNIARQVSTCKLSNYISRMMSNRSPSSFVLIFGNIRKSHSAKSEEWVTTYVLLFVRIAMYAKAVSWCGNQSLLLYIFIPRCRTVLPRCFYIGIVKGLTKQTTIFLRNILGI